MTGLSRATAASAAIRSTRGGVLVYHGAIGMMLFPCMLAGLPRRVGLVRGSMFAGTPVYGISTHGIRMPVFRIMIER